MRKQLLGAWVLGLALLPTAALAHAVLVKSIPAQRSSLTESPPRVELWFNERLEPAYSRASVTDEAGTQIDLRDALVSKEDARRLSLSLPPLRPGRYAVKFRVLSVDGHLVEGTFPIVWVEGEISNLGIAPSGHAYFTLKDAGAQISAVMWRPMTGKLNFKLADGLQVVASGSLSVYEKRGQYQIIVSKLMPKGLGALQLAFEQLKKQLAAEGLFDAARKKPIPMLPQRIAVVTSTHGAAIRDVLHVLARRYAGLHVQIYPVRVQGPSASHEIATAIRHLSRWELHDVLLICRGGGSLEDLWPFNEEIVARAIATCTIPTISGVGHETDFTISDLVAETFVKDIGHRIGVGDHRDDARAEIAVEEQPRICALRVARCER